MAPRYDKQQVLDAIRAGRALDVLQHVAKLPAEILDGEHHPCPKCGGTDRFRLVDPDAGAVLCNQCFHTKNGDALAAVRWMRPELEFWPAVAAVAEYLGVAPAARKSRQEADPEESLTFRDWNEGLARLACLHRDPIQPDAFLAAGARLAEYRRMPVVAVPVRRSADASEKPVGYALLHGMGGKSLIPKYDREGKLVDEVKVKLTFGSKKGWLGPV